MTSEGVATRITDENAPREIGPIYDGEDLLLAQDYPYGGYVALISEGSSWMLTLIDLPPVAPACSDDFDNDADGYVDHPDDTGCVSIYDASETLVAVPEPGQLALLAAGFATLLALSRTRARS